jgi:hypothetical protein
VIIALRDDTNRIPGEQFTLIQVFNASTYSNVIIKEKIINANPTISGMGYKIEHRVQHN